MRIIPVANESTRAIWAIDIGGTTTRIGIVDADGTIRRTTRIATPTQSTPDAFSTSIAAAANSICAGHPPIESLCGVAVPGILEQSSTRVLRAVNLPWLEGVSIRDMTRGALGISQIVVHNDVLCAGYAQWRACRPTIDRFAYLSIGTGVAACVILNGAPIEHTRGGPGHFGHLVVDTSPSAPLCRCGNRGCLEACIGGWALAERGGLPDAALLARGLNHLATVYAPDHIAVGGGVAENHPDWVRHAVSTFESLRTTIMPRGLTLSAAPLATDQAGLTGAALLAMDRLRNGGGSAASAANPAVRGDSLH